MGFNMMIAGVGGQGTLFASKRIAEAALAKDLPVRTAETIGMAQRGGCVASHIRIGDNIHSPLIPHGGADLILAFEPGEAARNLPYLKPYGCIITADKPIRSVQDSLNLAQYDGKNAIQALADRVEYLFVLDTSALFAITGTAKTLNVALLAYCAGRKTLPFSAEELLNSILSGAPTAFQTANQKAFDAGMQLSCIEHGKDNNNGNE